MHNAHPSSGEIAGLVILLFVIIRYTMRAANITVVIPTSRTVMVIPAMAPSVSPPCCLGASTA